MIADALFLPAAASSQIYGVRPFNPVVIGSAVTLLGVAAPGGVSLTGPESGTGESGGGVE
ncbi:MAG TPA: hypothetical protein VNW97_21570 [Candidatus Saccharimonadales bacterium]|nr:hypothetical protein [Candidatus Saccharimonadales bacterium]